MQLRVNNCDFPTVVFIKPDRETLETCVRFVNINHMISFVINIVSIYNYRHSVWMFASLIFIYLISLIFFFWLISNSTYSIQFFIHPKPSHQYMRFILKRNIYKKLTITGNDHKYVYIIKQMYMYNRLKRFLEKADILIFINSVIILTMLFIVVRHQ